MGQHLQSFLTKKGLTPSTYKVAGSTCVGGESGGIDRVSTTPSAAAPFASFLFSLSASTATTASAATTAAAAAAATTTLLLLSSSTIYYDDDEYSFSYSY